MNKKRILILGLEVIFIAAIIAGVFIASKQVVKETDVYVFARDINCGTIITFSDITVGTVPKGAINDSFVFAKDDIIGKMAGVDVKKGDYILKNYLVEQSESSYTYEDLSKLRTVSFSVDLEDALAGNISRGDIIDLVYTGTGQNAANGQPFTYSTTFLEGVYVWTVSTADGYPYSARDKSYYDETTFSGKQETSLDTNGDYGELAMITVLLTPSQAADLETRKSTGRISILGRFSNGVNTPSTGFVLGGYSGVYTGYENPEKINSVAVGN